MTDEPRIDDTKRYEFYRDQFARHANRVMEYQKERLRVSIVAITGMAAMFAWLSTSAGTNGPAQISKGMYFVPAILAAFGLAFHWAVHISVLRHVGFMNMIETEILNISPYDVSAWDHYKERKDETKCFGKLVNIIGYVFWVVLIVAAIVVACAFRRATS